ncbi:hypothetical protein N7526_003464 [Penicillium atrosanguineum]|nr:hypothetical protein N7526_003464 [Penicillium atrosanguineum]
MEEASHPLMTGSDDPSNSSIDERDSRRLDSSLTWDSEGPDGCDRDREAEEKYLGTAISHRSTGSLILIFWRRCGVYLSMSAAAVCILVIVWTVVHCATRSSAHHDQKGVDPGDEPHRKPLVTTWPSGVRLSPAGLPLECGTTNEEAIANGCIFDVIVYCWIPPACYEPDLAADVVSETSRYAPFHKAGHFDWYGDADGLELVAQDPVVLRERAEIWATHEWHQTHCLYFWRLLGRAVSRSYQDGWEGAYVLSQAIVFPHTLHCNDMLADQEKDGNDLIRTLRVYGTCIRLDEKPDPYLEHGTFPVNPE